MLDRDGAAAEAAAAALREDGNKAIALTADVADWASVDNAFATVRSELGPVEILVTSAGIESFDSAVEITQDTWDRIIAVNLTGTFTCAQAAIPDMLAAGWGRIVTISSSSAQSGAPRMAHYAASKGGVIGLTKALAVELARSGITVNTIPPSLVDTPMARAAEAAGDFPGVDVVAPDGACRPGWDPGRHRRGVLVPVLRQCELHHGPGHRRERRHVHLNRLSRHHSPCARMTSAKLRSVVTGAKSANQT